MFPFTAEDTIEIPLHGNDDHIREVVIEALIGKLHEERPEDLIRTDGTIKFRMPVFRRRRWFRFDFLGAVRGGEIQMQSLDGKLLIHYSISFLGTIIATTLLLLLIGIIAQPILPLELPAQIFIGVLGWVIFVGAVVVLTRLYFSTLVYNTAVEIVNVLSSKESTS